MSRIMGEAAPLVVVGAAALVLFDPEPLAGLQAETISLSFRFRFISGHPSPSTHGIRGCSCQHHPIVLLAAMNNVAIILREHFRRRLNP